MKIATRTSPSTRCWTNPLSMLLVVSVAMISGSRKKTPIPATRVRSSIRATAPRPSSTPSSDAASDADRTSQRVPTTSVSYRTTSPRTSGSFAQRLPWKPESRRSVCPHDAALGAAEGDGDRIATAHQDALDEGLSAVGVARHRRSLPARRALPGTGGRRSYPRADRSSRFWKRSTWPAVSMIVCLPV